MREKSLIPRTGRRGEYVMLTTTHRSEASYPNQRWKNGQGETFEIAVDTQSPYRWRLSSAKLSGRSVFSSFPEYQRLLVLLTGGPVTLVHEEVEEILLTPYHPYSFAGKRATTSKALTEAEDFNAFFLNEKAKGTIYPVFIQNGEEIQFPVSANEHFLFCVDGSLDVFEPNTKASCALQRRETFQVSRHSKKEYLNLKARGTSDRAIALWVVIHLLGKQTKDNGRPR